MNEYLLAGTQLLHSQWPDAARLTGVLLCTDNHAGACTIKTGCCIGNDSARFNVMPIIGVDGMDCDPFDTVLIVTLLKKYLNVESTVANSVIREFLNQLQTQGVRVFQSELVGKQRIWVDFR